MKKFYGCFLSAVTLTAAFMLAVLGGCGKTNEEEEKTGEAYSLTHSDGYYISKATVTVKGSDITAATLEEVFTPLSYTADEGDGEYTVEDGGEYFYKTVKYADITLTYDEQAGDYMVDSQTMTEYFTNEANAKAYFDAVSANNVTVVTSAGEDKTIICNDTANKEKNGYWTRTYGENDTSYSRWKVNRDATINYVITYDGDAFGEFTKSETAITDSYGVDTYYWVDSNGINSGASWVDMYITEASRAATGYIQLMQKAYNAAK